MAIKTENSQEESGDLYINLSFEFLSEDPLGLREMMRMNRDQCYASPEIPFFGIHKTFTTAVTFFIFAVVVLAKRICFHLDDFKLCFGSKR